MSGNNALERVRSYRLTFNNVYEFASQLNIPRNYVDYVERQYSHIHKSVNNSIDKISIGYEQLSGTSASASGPVSMDDVSLLLSFSGHVMDDTFTRLLLRHTTRKVIKPQQLKIDVDESDVFAQAEEDNYHMDNNDQSQQQLESPITDITVEFTTFLTVFRAYLTLKMMTITLGEMKGLVTRGAQETFSSAEQTLQYEPPRFDFTTGLQAGGADESVVFGDDSMMLMNVTNGTDANGNTNNTMFFGSSSIHRPASDPRDNKQQHSISQQFQQSSQHQHYDRSQMLQGTVPEDSQMQMSTLPPLRLNKNFTTGLQGVNQKGKRKLLAKGGFDESLSRGTPRVLQSSANSGPVDIHVLRHELQLAQEGVKQLNKMVDTNIAWVQSNCDMSSMPHMTSNFSSRTKQKCKSMATERIFHVISRHAQITLIWALKRWKVTTSYVELHEVSNRYAKIKAIDIMTNTMYEVMMKQFLRGWTPMFKFYRKQQMVEQTAASNQIQRVIRGFLGRIRFRMVKMSKKVVVIQGMFRKTKARAVVADKRKLVAKRALQKKKHAAARVMQNWARDRQSIKDAKAEAERRRKLKEEARLLKIKKDKQAAAKKKKSISKPLISPPKKMSVLSPVKQQVDLEAAAQKAKKPSIPTQPVDEEADLLAALEARENAVQNDFDDESALALSLQATIDFVSSSSKHAPHTPTSTLGGGKGKSMSLMASPGANKRSKHGASIARVRVDSTPRSAESESEVESEPAKEDEVTVVTASTATTAPVRLKKSATSRELGVSPQRMLSADKRAESSASLFNANNPTASSKIGRILSPPPSARQGTPNSSSVPANEKVTSNGSDKSVSSVGQGAAKVSGPAHDKRRLQGSKAPALGSKQASTRLFRRSLTNDEIAAVSSDNDASKQTKKAASKLSRSSFDSQSKDDASVRSKSPDNISVTSDTQKQPEKRSTRVAVSSSRRSTKEPSRSTKVKTSAVTNIQKVARGKLARTEAQKQSITRQKSRSSITDDEDDGVEELPSDSKNSSPHRERVASPTQILEEGEGDFSHDSDQLSNLTRSRGASPLPGDAASLTDARSQQDDGSLLGGFGLSEDQGDDRERLALDTAGSMEVDDTMGDQFSPQTHPLHSPERLSQRPPTRDGDASPQRGRSADVSEVPKRPRSCSPSLSSFTLTGLRAMSPLRPFTPSALFKSATDWLTGGSKKKSSDAHPDEEVSLPDQPLEVQEKQLQRQQSIKQALLPDENSVPRDVDVSVSTRERGDLDTLTDLPMIDPETGVFVSPEPVKSRPQSRSDSPQQTPAANRSSPGPGGSPQVGRNSPAQTRGSTKGGVKSSAGSTKGAGSPAAPRKKSLAKDSSDSPSAPRRKSLTKDIVDSSAPRKKSLTNEQTAADPVRKKSLTNDKTAVKGRASSPAPAAPVSPAVEAPLVVVAPIALKPSTPAMVSKPSTPAIVAPLEPIFVPVPVVVEPEPEPEPELAIEAALEVPVEVPQEYGEVLATGIDDFVSLLDTTSGLLNQDFDYSITNNDVSTNYQSDMSADLAGLGINSLTASHNSSMHALSAESSQILLSHESSQVISHDSDNHSVTSGGEPKKSRASHSPVHKKGTKEGTSTHSSAHSLASNHSKNDDKKHHKEREVSVRRGAHDNDDKKHGKDKEMSVRKPVGHSSSHDVETAHSDDVKSPHTSRANTPGDKTTAADKTAAKPAAKARASIFGGGNKTDKADKKNKSTEKMPDKHKSKATAENNPDVERIQRMARQRLARAKIARKKAEIQQQQSEAALMINWATITIQRTARGKLGRERFLEFYNIKQNELNRAKLKSATKIQSRTRGMRDRKKVSVIKGRIEAEQKELEWLKSFQKGSRNNKASEEVETVPVVPASPVVTESKKIAQAAADAAAAALAQSNELVLRDIETPNTVAAAVVTDAKILEIEEKIRRLEMIEKSVQERERIMEAQEKKAAEQQKAIADALAEMIRRNEVDDKERKQRDELLALAQGQISHRSEYASTGPKMSARISARNKYSQPTSARDHEGPPTARSARGGAGIPPDAPRMRHGGEEWVQLWDPEETAYYWYCERTQTAQWETPGGDFNDRETDESGTESGYNSEGAMTDYSTDYNSDYGGQDSGSEWENGQGEWAEYWDEQAQAKYWYNNNTGEASWTKPAAVLLLQDGASARSAMVPYNGGIASQQSSQQVVQYSARSGMNTTSSQVADNPLDWASFLDEDTGQEYWYNSKTGQSSILLAAWLGVCPNRFLTAATCLL
eukprot:gene24541-30900_t